MSESYFRKARNRRLACSIVLLAALSLASRLCADDQPHKPFDTGDKVEVREGDVWTPGTVLAREGHRYHVHYGEGPDAVDEWMAIDRLRILGTADKPTTPAAPGAPTPTDNASNPNIKFPAGTAIEFASGFDSWKPGHVVGYEFGLAGVREDSVFHSAHWVQIWALRRPGSSYDFPHHPDPEDVHGSDQPRTLPQTIENYLTNNKDVQNDYGDVPVKQLITPDVADDPNFARMTYTDEPRLHPLNLTPPSVPADPLWIDPAAAREHIALQHPTDQGDQAARGSGANLTADLFCSSAPIIYSLNTHGSGSRITATALVRQNLHTQKVDAPFSLPLPLDLLAVAPNGNAVLLGHHKSADPSKWGKPHDLTDIDFVELFDTTGPTPKPVVAFAPYAKAAERPVDAPRPPVNHGSRMRAAPGGAGERKPVSVTSAALVDATHVFTTGSSHIAALWDTAAKQMVYAITTDGIATISPNGKYAAVSQPGQIVLLDAATGDAKGIIPTDDNRTLNLIFTPSGKSLIVATNVKLDRWDLTTGKQTASIGIPHELENDATALSDDYLLSGNVVYDLTLGIPLVQYTDLPWTSQGAGAPLWLASDGAYSTATLPNTAALNFAKSLDTSTLIVVRLGMKLSLTANISADDPTQKACQAALQKAVARNGWTIADGQPVQIIAETTDGPSKEVHYHDWRHGPFGGPFGPFGGGDPGTDMNIPGKNSALRIMVDGKEVWSKHIFKSAPGFVQVKAGESIESAVNEANVYNYSLFENAAFPPTIPRKHDGEAFLITMLDQGN